MTNSDIARQRLYNQHIAQQTFKKPEDIVEWMGAVQAQDYAGAKWALGLRLQNSKESVIEKAINDGSIIRTHVLRPTWHFVSPADVRWMLELTAPRIIAASASQHRALQLDNAIFKRSNDAMAKALDGNKQLNRAELKAVLEQAGIATDDIRFILLLMHAELDKVICNGGRQGKQFTYTLFDDRVPASKPILKDEALAKLAQRYFTSRGPATLKDFTWWSGLTPADAKKALEIVKDDLTKRIIENREYWMAQDQPIITSKTGAAYLLPAFDEFAVAYTDRTAIVNPLYLKQAGPVISNPVIVVNNQVAGTWKRTINKKAVEISLNPFGKLNKTQLKAINAVERRYRKFIDI